MTDDSISGGDKLLKMLEGLLVAAPLAISGVQGVAKILPTIATQLGAVSVEAGVTATMADIM